MGEGEKYCINQSCGFWDKSVGIGFAVLLINFIMLKRLMIGGGMV